jgi:hypothetical protein
MGKLNSRIEELLTSSQVALSNMHSDAELQIALAAYGCTTERLAHGQALRDRAMALSQQQGVAYGDLTSTSSELAQAQAQAQADYSYYVKIARVTFATDPGALRKLSLNVARKQSRAGWMLQAEQFYANALADDTILSKLNRLDVTRDKLMASKQQLAAVGAYVAARQSHKGEAQRATKARNEALLALNTWMVEFRDTARLALKHQPTSLKKLGMSRH